MYSINNILEIFDRRWRELDMDGKPGKTRTETEVHSVAAAIWTIDGHAYELVDERRERDGRWKGPEEVLATMETLARQLHQRLVLHLATRTVELATGGGAAIRRANRAAASEDWIAAARGWEAARHKGRRRTRAAATFNLGVHAERSGDLSRALQLYEDAEHLGEGSAAEQTSLVRLRRAAARCRKAEGRVTSR